MKPLPTAPLTVEDYDAWADVIDRMGHDTAVKLGLSNILDISDWADRRDAALMWGWQCQEMETLHMSRLERLRWLGIGLEVRT